MKTFRQLIIIIGINLTGSFLTEWAHLPIPGAISGMIILLIMLFTGIIKPKHIEETADFLLKNMAFFFLPAGVGILASYQLVRGSYLQTIAIIVISTILVMAISAVITQKIANTKRNTNE